MKAIITDKEALQALKPQQIENYLRKKGYPCTETSIKATYWGIGDWELGLPSRTDYADYSFRVCDVLTTLANAENRSQLDIYAEIANEERQ